MSGGGVGLVMLSAVLGGQPWPLLFGLSVPIFRSSSRVSDSGWRYGALRSRAREQGLTSASETEHGLWPFVVRVGWFSSSTTSPFRVSIAAAPSVGLCLGG
jgi:hypothetical protein